ncbi:ABC transporter substrate-binding protein [Paracoccus sp. CPCC 101403]|uniref:ABC transporter substrate-binding protein n=1 Tax=Paracoccus broussonetiae TaxID=3075834 RepID=A0ABU3E958_9RHOB|nr:ABC transporter substrate-binding protein [Paracoccus sp. CPCC 101403]MDT1060754.1 ABC transporter substrate-binding protein [Paracoccus sp. CPCC 101403]
MRLLLSASLLGLVATSAAAADKTLTISVYGISQDAYKEALYTPFEAKCGCKLVVEMGNSSERLAKLEANKAKPVVDVIAYSDANALEAAGKDLIQPVDPAKLPNLADAYEFARDPVGGNMAVGYTFYGTSIVYDSDVIDGVGSWLDLFGDKLKGQVALPNVSTTQGPLALQMIETALGSDDPKFAKAIDLVADHRDDIVTFYEKGGQIPQLMQQGEIAASVIGRFGWANLLKTVPSARWATPKEGQSGGMNVLSIVKGAHDPDLAHQFIDYWLSAEVQQKLAEGQVDSPVNQKVTVSDEIAEGLTYGPEMATAIKFLPAKSMLENRDAWLEAWNAKVAQ